MQSSRKAYSDALQSIGKALELVPSSNSALILKATIQVALGSFRGACQTYALISEPDASDPAVLIGYARALYHTGSFREAYARVTRLLVNDEKNPDLWHLRAEIERAQGLFDEAAHALTQACKYAPNNKKLQSLQGIVLYEAGKYPEAISVLEKVLEVDSQNGELWKRKGAAHEALLQYELASAAY